MHADPERYRDDGELEGGKEETTQPGFQEGREVVAEREIHPPKKLDWTRVTVITST